MAKQKPSRTLAQMSAEAATSSDGSIVCPRCHCVNFRVYKTDQGTASTFRYKSCRNCGHRVLTSTKSAERIIRDVDVRNADDGSELDSVVKFA